ncbi:hypothetical protein H310_12026 [Aphanomyces invadans]|uniref:Rho-GAP domain-containing protein n=1 Tax=Aphanomyces invadans TaxID=157072 RepID=A0A024TLC4_9STRA|nr:hypothetical protein H310_12026 [Aphanomyces invadans]ETV94391.1 hypothetical protein H310_12026 [Aphanomyces invadans]|eukprot:XP_008877153.1 hypothetical protein H310_12026 [Aphanomyces invadans]
MFTEEKGARMRLMRWKLAARKTTAVPSHEELPKISVQAARLLMDLVGYLDKLYWHEECLYDTKGTMSPKVEELFMAFQQLTTSTATFTNLAMYPPHVIATTIKKILQRYQPLLTYTRSHALMIEAKLTPDSIAAHLSKIRGTNRDVLRVLLCHWKRISEHKHMKGDASRLAQSVGVLTVRPTEDLQTLGQRAVLKARIRIARELIRGAKSWPYGAAAIPNVPTKISSADWTSEGFNYAIKLVWYPEDGVTYDEDRLRAQLTPHCAIHSIAMHPTKPKARVAVHLKKAKALDKIVVKLQSKAQLHVVHVQILANMPVGDGVPVADNVVSPPDRVDVVEPVDIPPVEEISEKPGHIPIVEPIPATTLLRADRFKDQASMEAEDVLCMQLFPEAAPVVMAASFSTQTNHVVCVDAIMQTDGMADTEQHNEVSAQTEPLDHSDVVIDMVPRVRRVIEVLETTTASVADCSTNETIRAMHQAQVQVLHMLESIVKNATPVAKTSSATFNRDDTELLEYRHALDAHLKSKATVLEAEVLAAQELLRMHKAQTTQQMESWQVEAVTLRMVALEAERQSMELREELRSTRSELACQLAMLSHLKRDNAALQEKLLLVETKAECLERDTTDQKAQLVHLQDVAAKAQLRVEAYKAIAPSFDQADKMARNEATSQPDATPKPSSVDVLIQLKEEMSQRLQTQIDYTKATIDAMDKQDPTSVHLIDQQRQLSTLVTGLVNGDKTGSTASQQAMEISREKLNHLSDAMSFPRAHRAAFDSHQRHVARPPLSTTTRQWISQIYAQAAPPRMSKANPDSLNAARLSLQNFHHVVGYTSIPNA